MLQLMKRSTDDALPLPVLEDALSLKRFARLPLQLSFFQKAKVSRAVEDDVVEQLDAYDFTSRFELGGDLDVIGRWFKAAAGVIVGHDEGRCGCLKGDAEDDTRVDRRPVNPPARSAHPP